MEEAKISDVEGSPHVTFLGGPRPSTSQRGTDRRSPNLSRSEVEPWREERESGVGEVSDKWTVVSE